MTQADTPPTDTNAEKAVLSSILIRPEVISEVEGILAPRDFHSPWFREVYYTMIALRLAGTPIDVALVLPELKRVGKIEDPAFFLSEIAVHQATAANAGHYAKIVRECANKRRLLDIADTIAADAKNGKASNEILNDLLSATGDMAGSSSNSGFSIERLSSRELATGDFTTNYLVDGVIPAGQPGVASGRFKTLKTGTVIDLSISMATGTPFLGHFDVPEPVRVAIVSAESGKAALKNWGQRIARSKGLELADIDNLIWSTTLPQLGDASHLRELEKFIVDEDLRCVTLDPTYLAMSHIGDVSSNVFAMGTALMPLTDLVTQTECTVLLVNHNRKNVANKFAPPELEDISQSGFAEWSRFWLLLGPRREWSEERCEHWLWLRTGGSSGHSGLWHLGVLEGRYNDPGGRVWDVNVCSATEGRRNEQESRGREKKQKEHEQSNANKNAIVEALYGLTGRRETARQIRELSGINSRYMATTLAELVRDSIITPCKITKNGKQFDGFELVDKEK